MKYIIVDLDDTFLRKDKTVSSYTLDKIKEFQEKGFLFVFNTARSYLASKPCMDLLHPNYTICNGGALILDSNENIIYQKTMSKELTNLIIQKIKKDEDVLNFSIQGVNGLYSPDITYVGKNPIANYFSFEEEFMEDSYKVLISSLDSSHYKKLAEELGLYFESYFDGLWFRLCPTTKALGNQMLFKILKDENPMDYVFGDDTGDLEMIQKAYHGVLLCNASDTLKGKVKHITKWDNNEDGVMCYLEELFMSNIE